MNHITVVGTGYVGLVTGACFAEMGNIVTCVDINPEKIKQLQNAEIPFFEPGLSDLVKRNIQQERLFFTHEMTELRDRLDLVFICVGTPSREDGSADLSQVFDCAQSIADMTDRALMVIKSTVPVGTHRRIRAVLDQKGKKNIHLVSNPEFLREGTAVKDSLVPDRVVVGVSKAKVGETMRALYKPFFRSKERTFVLSPESAEMTKYAANCYLATRISFMNEISQLCEEMGADVTEVRQAMGADQRIGTHYLYPSVGIGGSCFPKDLRAMKAMFDGIGLRPEILSAVLQTNQNQKNRFFQKICKHFGGLEKLDGRQFGIWGVAFKANTDDVRESAALDIIQKLLDARASVTVFDPEAIENTQNIFGDQVQYASSIYQASENADAICVMTEWNQFRDPDFLKLKTLMKTPIIFDGRNLFDPQALKAQSFQHFSIGRP